MTAVGSEKGASHEKLFCFGLGYTAAALARRVRGRYAVAGTRRQIDMSQDAAGGDVVVRFDGTRRVPDVAAALEGATHVLLSVPPSAAGDPVLAHHAADLAARGSLEWIGYLSTVGVYGDAGGGWVDEASPTTPASARGQRRADAEESWRAFGRTHGKRVEIFRLPGIYGPGRSAIDTVRAGTARRVVKPGQVFNRVHVDDIAAALALAMAAASAKRLSDFDTFNVVDDEPAPPQDVIVYAAALLGVPPPPEQPLDVANLTEMAASFWRENKRVRNGRLKAALGWTPAYPTYREGLVSCLAK